MPRGQSFKKSNAMAFNGLSLWGQPVRGTEGQKANDDEVMSGLKTGSGLN